MIFVFLFKERYLGAENAFIMHDIKIQNKLISFFIFISDE